MNEIIRVHIAGIPYEIDVEAKKQLDKYMAAIRSSLGTAEDALDDIEVRITELLAEQGVNKDGVIRKKHVKVVQERLGSPKDFSSDEKTSKGEKIADKIRTEFSERKYFRDTENGMLGGVVAGFSAYTGWDLTLLRVLVVILAICTAFFPFVLLYIVAWICTPEVKTASDFLAMKGEPVNVENIKNVAKDFAGKAEKGARSAGEKMKKHTPAAGNTALRIVLGFFGVIGLMVFVPILVLLIPATAVLAFSVAGAGIEAKPLFVATMILLAIMVFTVVLIEITLSVALIKAKIGNSVKMGLVSSTVFVIALAVAASVTGGIWCGEVGRDGVRDTMVKLVEKYVVEVNDNDVQVQVGPIRVRADRDYWGR
jgi:phage shock protein PspC (stress-responsive transcriptional regulator)